jgi:hypothetical protein
MTGGLSPKMVQRQAGARRGYCRYAEGADHVEEGRAPFDRLDVARLASREGAKQKRRFAPADVAKLHRAARAAGKRCSRTGSRWPCVPVAGYVILDPATAAAALITNEIDWCEIPNLDLTPMRKANMAPVCRNRTIVPPKPHSRPVSLAALWRG